MKKLSEYQTIYAAEDKAAEIRAVNPGMRVTIERQQPGTDPVYHIRINGRLRCEDGQTI